MPVVFGAGANVNLYAAGAAAIFPSSWGDMSGLVFQQGDTIECQVEVVGDAASGNLTISPPTGWTVDSSKLLAELMPMGTGRAIDSATTEYGPFLCLYNIASNIIEVNLRTTAPNTMTSVSATVPFSFGAGDVVVLEFFLPVTTAAVSIAYGMGASATGNYVPFQAATTTGTFTNATYETYVQRDGDMLACRSLVTLTGTPGAAALALDPPDGWTVDATKLVDGAVLTDSGGRCQDTSTNSTRGPLIAVWDAANSRIQFMICTTSPNTVTNVTQATPFIFATTDVVVFHYKLPINAGPAQTVALGNGAGEAYSEWTTLTAECTNHTNISVTGKVRRIGNHLWVHTYAICTDAPAGTGALGFVSELGATVDTSKLLATGLGSGHCWSFDAAPSSRGPGIAHYRSSLGEGSMTLEANTTAPNTGTGITRTFPFTLAVNDTIKMLYKVPVL